MTQNTARLKCCGFLFIAILSVLRLTEARISAQDARTTMVLDGDWQMAEGSMEDAPSRFDHTVPVPGLVDMAKPAFAEVGTTNSSQRREAFWYRRTFRIPGAVPPVALLKIHKAAYGSRVYLNGAKLGDHLPSFTPGYFDARPSLKGHGAENELLVRVGAYRDAVPPRIPAGWDFEKVKYIPGIFDSVELILSGTPHLVRVQTVPDITDQIVRVHALVRNSGPATNASVNFTVREAKSGRIVGAAQSKNVVMAPGAEATVEVTVPIAQCRLWSPEDPFLYALEAGTGADTLKTRFGMREFRFDPATGRAVLNGKPRFLRGSNVTLYRFFEDPERGDRPWRAEWVRRLHRKFKEMHWDTLRYCIGFPPEFWYDIADEEGFLIQDEYPLWHLGWDRFKQTWPAQLTSEQLAREYTEWMQERWNHPCVVIWDAQNETITEETGQAIQAVRALDLSQRPWDNGWGAAQAPNDCNESHPYVFQNPAFKLADLARVAGKPVGNPNGNKGNNPIILNEYGWLWLNRDGSATTLTREVYQNLLGPNSTTQERRHLYARYLAALTEFWRCHRACAGVLHFCGLGYSRPDGQTSDHFLDIEQLTYEPEFERYVKDAFAPVGLMIDEWADEMPAGAERQIPVVVISDLHKAWTGTVRLRILQKGTVISESSEACEIAPLGEVRRNFACTIPRTPGDYQIEAALLSAGEKPVLSLRDFSVLTAAQKQARDGLALGRPTKASSVITRDGTTYRAEYATDGDRTTRWSSEFADPQWLTVDLGAPTEISRVELFWETAFGKAYTIEVSTDGTDWTEVYATQNGKGKTEIIRFSPVAARWVRWQGTKRATEYGYSLWELRIFK